MRAGFRRGLRTSRGGESVQSRKRNALTAKGPQGYDPQDDLLQGSTEPGRMRFTSISTLAVLVLLSQQIGGGTCRRVIVGWKVRAMRLLASICDQLALVLTEMQHLLPVTVRGHTLILRRAGVVHGWAAIMQILGSKVQNAWNKHMHTPLLGHSMFDTLLHYVT